DGGLDRAGGEQRGLVEVDVEVGAELVQRLLDVGEHQLDALGAEQLVAGGLGQRGRLRVRGHDLLGDLGDVGAGVAVLRGGLPGGGGDQRGGEAVDLRAVVVEVV